MSRLNVTGKVSEYILHGAIHDKLMVGIDWHIQYWILQSVKLYCNSCSVERSSINIIPPVLWIRNVNTKHFSIRLAKHEFLPWTSKVPPRAFLSVTPCFLTFSWRHIQRSIKMNWSLWCLTLWYRKGCACIFVVNHTKWKSICYNGKYQLRPFGKCHRVYE